MAVELRPVIRTAETEMQRRYRSWYPARQQRFTHVVGLMQQMAPAQFEAFRLCLWLGYSHDEAAAILNTKPNLVQLARWRSEHFLDRHCASFWKTDATLPRRRRSR